MARWLKRLWYRHKASNYRKCAEENLRLVSLHMQGASGYFALAEWAERQGRGDE